jgi:hypothetical protein
MRQVTSVRLETVPSFSNNSSNYNNTVKSTRLHKLQINRVKLIRIDSSKHRFKPHQRIHLKTHRPPTCPPLHSHQRNRSPNPSRTATRTAMTSSKRRQTRGTKTRTRTTSLWRASSRRSSRRRTATSRNRRRAARPLHLTTHRRTRRHSCPRSPRS